MSKKTSTIFYHDWYEQFFQDLTDEEVGILTIAILKYDSTGELPEFDDRYLSMVFRQIKKTLDYNQEKYEERCEKNRQNVMQRWNKEKASDPETEEDDDTNVYDRIQSNTNVKSRIKNDTKNTDILTTDILNTDNNIYNDLTLNTKVYTGEQSDPKSGQSENKENKTFFSEKYHVPSREEVGEYFAERLKTRPEMDPEHEATKFFKYYDTRKWEIMGRPIQYWLSVADKWIENAREKKSTSKKKYINFDQRDYDYSQIEKVIMNRG